MIRFKRKTLDRKKWREKTICNININNNNNNNNNNNTVLLNWVTYIFCAEVKVGTLFVMGRKNQFEKNEFKLTKLNTWSRSQSYQTFIYIFTWFLLGKYIFFLCYKHSKL